MATVPLSPALGMASSKPRWVMCFMNVREVEFWKITGQKTDKVCSGKITPFWENSQSARSTENFTAQGRRSDKIAFWKIRARGSNSLFDIWLVLQSLARDA